MRCNHGRTTLSSGLYSIRRATSVRARFDSSIAFASRVFTTGPALQSRSSFAYHIAAAFSAKQKGFDPMKDVFDHKTSGALSFPDFPHTSKALRPNSGQDAFFISDIGHSAGEIALGIADGVGGWSVAGVDSADFAHGLCKAMADAARGYQPDTNKRLHAKDIMEMGYQKLIRDSGIRGGGSTACVAVAREEGVVEVANLGDSGFVQLRLNAVNYQSDPQTHAFNTPYQLSLVPPKQLARERLFGGRMLRDLPKDAHVTSHDVRHGDILVFASDGVWDNLSSQDLLQRVSHIMKVFDAWPTSVMGGVRVGEKLESLTKDLGSSSMDNYSLQKVLATILVSEAKQASRNTRVDGPFAREVNRNFPHERFRGGKVDDICLIVAIVVQHPPPEETT